MLENNPQGDGASSKWPANAARQRCQTRGYEMIYRRLARRSNVNGRFDLVGQVATASCDLATVAHMSIDTRTLAYLWLPQTNTYTLYAGRLSQSPINQVICDTGGGGGREGEKEGESNWLCH